MRTPRWAHALSRFEVISYCEAGAARFAAALSAIKAAQRRDPQNWELRYSEALIRGVIGLDPRAAARAALDRYPESPLARAAVRAFATDDRRKWRRFALTRPAAVATAQPLTQRRRRPFAPDRVFRCARVRDRRPRS